jgi:uncharacterized glyoxalase superfamily protein PhnB
MGKGLQLSVSIKVKKLIEHVYGIIVDNIDEHFERAKREGAFILSEPEDGFPGHRYRAEDLEGHRWMFLQRE